MKSAALQVSVARAVPKKPVNSSAQEALREEDPHLAGALVCAAALTLASCATGARHRRRLRSPSASASASASGPLSRPAWSPTPAALTTSRSTRRPTTGLTDAKTELGIETGQVESQAAADFAEEHSVDGGCEVQHHRRHRWFPARAMTRLLPREESGHQVRHCRLTMTRRPTRRPRTSSRWSSIPAQSSFLAGYLAAGMTKTKKLGTFGGAKIPTVTIFMDGFSQGVDYYNKQKGSECQGARLGCCQAGRAVHR